MSRKILTSRTMGRFAKRKTSFENLCLTFFQRWLNLNLKFYKRIDHFGNKYWKRQLIFFASLTTIRTMLHSMTKLLLHTFVHFTGPSFMLKTKNTSTKKNLSLPFSWVNVYKNCKILTFKVNFRCQKLSLMNVGYVDLQFRSRKYMDKVHIYKFFYPHKRMKCESGISSNSRWTNFTFIWLLPLMNFQV